MNLSTRLLLCLGLAGLAGILSAAPFTYQGRLQQAGQPANGTYDLRVGLFNAASGAGQVGSTLTLAGGNNGADLCI